MPKDRAHLKQFAGWFPYKGRKQNNPALSFTFKFNDSIFWGFLILADKSPAQKLEIEFGYDEPVKEAGNRYFRALAGSPEATMDDGRSLLDRFSFFQTTATAASLIV